MSSEKNWHRLCAMDELAGGGLKRFEVAGIVVLATRVNDTTRVIPPFWHLQRSDADLLKASLAVES